ncbi:MAG: hypothetical protein JNN30_08835 [Rhodanobacteraceae bacterium]|nr:hypothetical protein [Rhodanobacteraceae bacterium]
MSSAICSAWVLYSKRQPTWSIWVAVIGVPGLSGGGSEFLGGQVSDVSRL